MFNADDVRIYIYVNARPMSNWQQPKFKNVLLSGLERMG